ncbi:MAG: DUF4347 domain-containing protein, partial [Pseudomonadota bacterium]
MLFDPTRSSNDTSVNRRNDAYRRLRTSSSLLALKAFVGTLGVVANRKGWRNITERRRARTRTLSGFFRVLRYKSKRQIRRARLALQRTVKLRSEQTAKTARETGSSFRQPAGGRPHGAGMLALEPRIVFDAAVAATADVAADQVAEQQAIEAVQALTQAAEGHGSEASAGDGELDGVDFASAGGSLGDGSERREIAFLDGGVETPAELLASLGDHVEVILIDRDRDGVEQIADVLQGRHGIDAVHIIAHGDTGVLNLGNTQLTTESIAGDHADELAMIQSALSDHADFLIYGCNFGADMAAVEALAQATGADVAASVDDTGHADFGGDWDLEVETGEIETAAVVAENWNGLLAPLVIDASGIQPSIDFPVAANVGETAVWSGAGTIGATLVDIHATVVSASAGTTVFFDTNGDDPEVDVETGPGTNSGEVTIRWEIFQAGTNIAAVGAPSITISDVDGDGAPFTVETVIPSLEGLQSVTTASATDINVQTQNGTVSASGTRRDDGVPPFDPNFAPGGPTRDAAAVTFTWSDTTSWEVTYRVDTANALRVFLHDGDGDFAFVGGTNTTTFTSVDLDADNSSGATNADYTGVYPLGSAAVAITDAVG